MSRLSKFLNMIIGTTLLFFSVTVEVTAADQHELYMAKVESWLKGYEEAWETLDADKATLLFTENAIYREDLYKDPYQGRENIHKYWTTVTADQKDVDFTFEILSVKGNTGIASLAF